MTDPAPARPPPWAAGARWRWRRSPRPPSPALRPGVRTRRSGPSAWRSALGRPSALPPGRRPRRRLLPCLHDGATTFRPWPKYPRLSVTGMATTDAAEATTETDDAPTVDDRDPATLIPAAVDEILELAPTCLAV